MEVVERTKLDMRTKWWWWFVVPITLLLYWKFQGWAADTFWSLLTAHAASMSVPSPTGRALQLLAVMVGTFLLVVLGFLVHAYFETRSELSFDGEVYRVIPSPRTAAWELVRDIYKHEGRADEPTVDTDILIELYMVNRHPKKVLYIRDFQFSAQIGGAMVQFKRQDDFRAMDFADKEWEYGLKLKDVFGVEPEPLKPLFSSVPVALSPEQPLEGWIRFTAAAINPDRLTAGTLKLVAIDSMGRNYPITKVPEREKSGIIGLRHFRG
jgi:hypothetical protein